MQRKEDSESVFNFGDLTIPIPAEDYEKVLGSELKSWLNKVESFDFQSFDGMKLHVYTACPDKPRGIVFFIHGFGEFFAKYYEFCALLTYSGYAFVFPELRGHGLSGREVDNPDLVHIESYDLYVKDIKALVERLVKPLSSRLSVPAYIFSHSMGGAITSLYLERYPEDFKKAILCAPMLKMKLGNKELPILFWLSLRKLFQGGKSLAPTLKPFDEVPDFENSNCLSYERYITYFKMRVEDPAYRTQVGTSAWVYASIRERGRLCERPAESEHRSCYCRPGWIGWSTTRHRKPLSRKSKNKARLSLFLFPQASMSSTAIAMPSSRAFIAGFWLFLKKYEEGSLCRFK